MTLMAGPRVLVAGLKGGGGKTLVALGLVAAWRASGRSVAPFKKGPDYIDAAWLSRAAGAPCRNLDLFLMRPDVVLRSFRTASARANGAVIEGNRGLFDGVDAQGSSSSAELAKLLRAPVVLTVDCTKATRTIAASVLGCQVFDSGVEIRGVVLNRTAGARHTAIVRDAVEGASGLPVLGAIPRLDDHPFPERHLGLVPPDEHADAARSIDQAAKIIAQHLDVDRLWDIASHASGLPLEENDDERAPSAGAKGVQVGVFRDAAFQFYYPENLDALRREGARLVEISPISDHALPPVHAVYVGGGFPESMAGALADNTSFNSTFREAIRDGLPVYAECGGAILLGETLVVDERRFPLTGILPGDFVLLPRPQGHGYTELETVGDNPFYTVGEVLRAHEFHYTRFEPSAEAELNYAFRVRRGIGYGGERDGLCRYNVLASYSHVHALGTETWAPALVAAAVRYRRASAYQSATVG